MSLFSSKLGTLENKGSDKPCDVCFKAKQNWLPFSLSDNKAKGCFDLIHYDIWGAYRIESLSGVHYFLSIVDDASRETWVYLMEDKSEVSKLVMNFCKMGKTQFNVGVKVIRRQWKGVYFRAYEISC